MSYKKSIITIMTLVVLLLLTMSTTIKAANVGKVYDLKATMDSTYINLTWDSVYNAKGYNVYVNGTRIGAVNTNKATLINFSENTTYRFKVAAYDYYNQEGTASSEVRLNTTVNETLAKVTNLEATQNNGYVTLNWSKVNNATKYQVFVDIPNFGNVSIGEVNSTNAMIQGFQNGLRYGFSVRACQVTSNGKTNYGETSNSKYITVNYNSNNDNDYNNDNYDYTKPAQVTNLSVSNITKNSAKASWSSVYGATGYEIYVSRNGGSYNYNGSTTRTSYTITDLSSNTSYKVKVRAYKLVNGTEYTGTFSNIRNFTTTTSSSSSSSSNTTKKPQVVPKVFSEVKNVNEAYISWIPVSDAEGYEVYLEDQYGNAKITDGFTTYCNYIFYSKQLEYSTTYKVKVRAYKLDDNRNRVYADYYQFTTFTTGAYDRKQNSAKVGQVTGLRHTVFNDGRVQLYWDKISGAEGYEIDFTVPGNTQSGSTILRASSNSTTIRYITDKNNNYTARVRAYKTINGEKVYGPYSAITKFTAK